MKITFQKRFLADLAKLPKEVRKGIEKFVFEEMPKLNSLGESGKIEQMKGYKAYYGLGLTESVSNWQMIRSALKECYIAKISTAIFHKKEQSVVRRKIAPFLCN